MSYVTLYRKFRPQTFDEVKGQDPIVTSLQNQLRTGHIGQAYLFTGTRGTGKTTVAKIFARAVNCLDPQDDGSPCNSCAPCRAALDGSSMNVIEIDAASNTGVQNVRDNIIEQVKYPPAEGKYKVFIIDEVHMLSPGAFNALLKTIEEPPEYVIFILATTEVQKVPITVRSRCQRYDFHRISIETIAARMRELMDIEKVGIEDRALSYVARLADGSMRDGLSILDKVISLYLGQEKAITYDDVLSALGTEDTEIFHKLLTAVLQRNAPGAVGIVEDAINDGRELDRFVSDLIWYLRDLMMAKSMKDGADLLGLSTENYEKLRQTASEIEDPVILRHIRILSDLQKEMRFSTQKRVILEVGIIRMCRPQMEADTGSLEARVEELEDRLDSGSFLPPAGEEGQIEGGGNMGRPSSPARVRKEKIPEATPDEVKKMAAGWKGFVSGVDDPLLRIYLDTAYVSVSKAGELELIYDMSIGKAAIAASWIASDDHLDLVKKEVNDYAGSEIPLTVKENSTGKDNKDLYEDAAEKFAREIGMPLEVEEDPGDRPKQD